MKRYLQLILGMAFLISCQKERITGSGEIKTESRPLKGFTRISISGSTHLIVTRGDDVEVRVTSYSNLLPYLETKIKDSTLLIAYKSNTNITNDNSEVNITLPVLEGLSTNGSGNITTSGDFDRTRRFIAAITGSGTITLGSGRTENFTAQIAGSGDLKGFGFITQNADITIAGSGNAEINVSGYLKASINGSGNIYYQGTPLIESNLSGSGTLIPK